MKYKDVLEWKENLSLLGIIIIVPLGLIFKTIWVVADAVWDSLRFCTKGCIWVILLVIACFCLVFAKNIKRNFKEAPFKIWEIINDYDY